MIHALEANTVREIVRQKCFYAILPRHGVYLHAPSPITDAEARRFARLFRETWQRMPSGPRRAILKYWRNCKPCGTLISPFIELSTGWFEQERRRGGHGLRATKAMASALGHRIVFWSKIVAVTRTMW
jgi:hypothetical protein